jgi:hypothetical protein
MVLLIRLLAMLLVAQPIPEEVEEVEMDIPQVKAVDPVDLV